MGLVIVILALIWAISMFAVLVRHTKRKTFFSSFLEENGGIESQEPLGRTDKLLAVASLVAFLFMLLFIIQGYFQQ